MAASDGGGLARLSDYLDPTNPLAEATSLAES